jgi:hypothetical protein
MINALAHLMPYALSVWFLMTVVDHHMSTIRSALGFKGTKRLVNIKYVPEKITKQNNNKN